MPVNVILESLYFYYGLCFVSTEFLAVQLFLRQKKNNKKGGGVTAESAGVFVDQTKWFLC